MMLLDAACMGMVLDATCMGLFVHPFNKGAVIFSFPNYSGIVIL